jgi:hypothetical protein
MRPKPTTEAQPDVTMRVDRPHEVHLPFSPSVLVDS